MLYQAQRELEVSLYQYLTSVLDGVASHRHAPVALPPGKRQGNHRTKGLMSFAATPERCGQEVRPCPTRVWIPNPPDSSESLYGLRYPVPYIRPRCKILGRLLSKIYKSVNFLIRIWNMSNS
jgi:hypothetical protein